MAMFVCWPDYFLISRLRLKYSKSMVPMWLSTGCCCCFCPRMVIMGPTFYYIGTIYFLPYTKFLHFFIFFGNYCISGIVLSTGTVSEDFNWFCFLQWKLHLFELEGEMKIDPPIKYVLYEVCTLFSFSSSSKGHVDRCFRRTAKLGFYWLCFGPIEFNTRLLPLTYFIGMSTSMMKKPNIRCFCFSFIKK